MLRSRASFAAALAGVALATATQASAATLVNFSFTAGANDVRGVFTLDCPPGAGPCAILALDGMFGATPVSRDPATEPPSPPVPPPTPIPPPSPDDLLTRPGYRPTSDGFDFWSGTTLHMFLRKEDEDRFKLLIYDQDLQERYSEYTVTDYTTSVPEPATWAMLLLGFAGAGAVLRGRRVSARV